MSRRPQGWTEIFLPAEERRNILRDIGREWGLKVFIETGTNDGATPWALKDQFDEIHTIELGQQQWAKASQLFESYPHVRCWWGDSSELLPGILEMVTRPALVWLDGHYSGPGTARGPIDTPVRDELTILLADRQRHIILVDDARIFKGEAGYTPEYKDYPTTMWVKKLAERANYSFTIEDDIMRLMPRETL